MSPRISGGAANVFDFARSQSLNQDTVVGSESKKLRRCADILAFPRAFRCRPSFWNSLQFHVRPSLLGMIPSAHMYGPQAIQGASTGPFAGSKLRAGSPAS